GNFLIVTTVPFGLRSARMALRRVPLRTRLSAASPRRSGSRRPGAGPLVQSAGGQVGDLLVGAKQELFDQVLGPVCHPQVGAFNPRQAATHNADSKWVLIVSRECPPLSRCTRWRRGGS